MGFDKTTSKSVGPSPGRILASLPDVEAQRWQRRARSMRVVLSLGVVAALVMIASSVYYYLNPPQEPGFPYHYYLIDIGAICVALALALIAYLCLRRGRLDAAGGWLLAGFLLAFGASELTWSGETLINVVGGVIIAFVMGAIILPRKWLAWLMAAVLYTSTLLLLNRFPLLPRHDVAKLFVETRMLVWSASALLALIVAWALIQAFRFGSIRSRLLISFVGLVLLVAIAIGAGVVFVGIENGQRQALERLESVATLKEAEINTWVKALQTDLATVLTGEVAQRANYVLTLDIGPLLDISYNRTLASFTQFVAQTGRFEDLMLINVEGEVVLSTHPELEGKNYGEQIFFARGLQETYLQPPYYDLELQQVVMVVARPVYNETGEVVGVFAGQVNMEVLRQILVERAGLGATGETYIVRGTTALTPLRTAYTGEITAAPVTQMWNNRSETALSGSFTNYEDIPVFGVYHWVPEMQVVLVAEQQGDEALQGVYNQLLTIGGLALAALLVAVTLSLFVTRSIANPLGNLAKTAMRIAEGDLELNAEVRSEDELGSLASAFNSMTLQLRTLISGLEQRVAERTNDLERRSLQLQASALVARQATEIQDLSQLLDTTVHLITERFEDYYHAGLFLLDEAREFAVLRAASSEGGKRMLARGHKLRVGEVGIVGHAASTGEPRIALDVGEDAQFFNNPDLPVTRSEVALPLRIGREVIGVLDVQSEKASAFNDEDVAILFTMADQVAVAIQNARLLSEMQDRIQEVSFLLRTQSQQGWRRFTEQRSVLGYSYDGVEVTPREAETVTSESQFSIPLQVRSGESLGRVDVQLGERQITAGERLLAQAIAEQASQALESARLFQQTQQALRRSEALYQAGRLLISFENVGDVLQAVADGIAAGLPADRVSAITFDVDARRVHDFVGGGPGMAQITAVTFDELTEGLSGWVLRELKPALSPKGVPDPRESPEVRQRRCETECGSIIIVPMMYLGRVLGTLTAINRPEQPDFTQDDVDLMVAMANQAAAAIQNARLFQETQALLDETEALYQASRLIGAARAPEEVLQAFVSYVTAPEVGRCVLAVLDAASTEARQVLHIVATWDRGAERAVPFSQRWDTEQIPYIGRHLTEPVMVSDLVTSPEMDALSRQVLQEQLGIRALATIPLYSGGRPLGWILMEVFDGPHEFSERDMRLFRALSDPASVVMENMRLLETTQRRADYELRKTEITSQVRASTDIDAILRTSVRELGKILRAEDALILLESAREDDAQPKGDGHENPA